MSVPGTTKTVISPRNRYTRFTPITEGVQLFFRRLPRAAYELWTWLRQQAKPGKLIEVSLKDAALTIGVSLRWTNECYHELIERGVWHEDRRWWGYQVRGCVVEPWNCSSSDLHKGSSDLHKGSKISTSNPCSSVPSFKESKDLSQRSDSEREQNFLNEDAIASNSSSLDPELNREVQSIPTREEVRPSTNSSSQPKPVDNDQFSAAAVRPVENVSAALADWAREKREAFKAWLQRRAERKGKGDPLSWAYKVMRTPDSQLISEFESWHQPHQPVKAEPLIQEIEPADNSAPLPVPASSAAVVTSAAIEQPGRVAQPVPGNDQMLEQRLGLLCHWWKDGRQDEARNAIASNPQWGIIITDSGPEAIS